MLRILVGIQRVTGQDTGVHDDVVQFLSSV